MSKKFSQILHPEVVLGLKSGPELRKVGDKFFLKDWYSEIHRYLEWEEHGGFYLNNNQDPETLRQRIGTSQVEDACISLKFKLERPPIYQVGRDFLRAIMKIDPVIPVDLLPESFFAHFSFPSGMVFDEQGDEVWGVYLYFGPAKGSCLGPEFWGLTGKILWGVYQVRKKNDFACARLTMDLSRPDTLERLTQGLPLDTDGEVHADLNVFRIAMNLALYINSVDCDLQLAPPVRDMKPAEKKERQQRGETINQCLLPVTFVSWEYQHPRVYSKETSWVDTFMRWQRCGPGLSQVKLIWVSPFERRYKNVKSEHHGEVSSEVGGPQDGEVRLEDSPDKRESGED